MRIDVEFFSEPWGMNSTIGNVKQVFRYKFGICFIHDIDFLPHFFYSFLFEEAADEVEWTTVEKIWKSSTEKTKSETGGFW